MKRINPVEGNKTFCMAPWTHTYLSPQMERRLCCSSLEKSENLGFDGVKFDKNGFNREEYSKNKLLKIGKIID